MIFHRIGNQDKSSWWLLVNGLLSYLSMSEWRTTVIAYAYYKCADCLNNNGPAPTDPFEQAALQFLKTELLKRKKPMPIIEAVPFLVDKIMNPLQQTYEKHKAFYINKHGGFREPFLKEGEEVLETVTQETIIFPDKQKVIIKQWLRGKHFYAKKGNQDIVVRGEQKWNTYESAKEAVRSIGLDIKGEPNAPI